VVGPEERTQPEGRVLTVPPDLEETLTQLAAVVGRLEQRPAPEASDDRLVNVEAAVKWASPWRQLIGLLAFAVVGLGAAYASLTTFAKEAVVETVRAAHQDESAPVEPSVATVNAIKTDVGSVKKGVDNLLKEDKRRKDVKTIEVELEQHDEIYQEKMQDFAAKKARGREPDKPHKSDRHIELEADRKETLTKKY